LPSVAWLTSATRSCSDVTTTCAAPALSNAAALGRVRVVAIGITPTLFAIWIAARPTLEDAAGMMTASPRPR
jgi:hypothetical protein